MIEKGKVMHSQRQYGIVEKNKAKSMEKLSSGYKINRASDDAAGLSQNKYLILLTQKRSMYIM